MCKRAVLGIFPLLLRPYQKTPHHQIQARMDKKSESTREHLKSQEADSRRRDCRNHHPRSRLDFRLTFVSKQTLVTIVMQLPPSVFLFVLCSYCYPLVPSSISLRSREAGLYTAPVLVPLWPPWYLYLHHPVSDGAVHSSHVLPGTCNPLGAPCSCMLHSLSRPSPTEYR